MILSRVLRSPVVNGNVKEAGVQVPVPVALLIKCYLIKIAISLMSFQRLFSLHVMNGSLQGQIVYNPFIRIFSQALRFTCHEWHFSRR